MHVAFLDLLKFYDVFCEIDPASQTIVDYLLPFYIKSFVIHHELGDSGVKLR